MEMNFLTGAFPYPANLYFDPEGEDGRPALVGTPGLRSFADANHYAETRGIHLFRNTLWAVIGNTLYQVSVGGTVTSKGTLITTSGPVFMADNGSQLLITDGIYGYLYDSAFAKIADADFPGASSVTFQDTYFIITQPDTGKVYVSATNDGSSWDALDFATAEGHPDDALAVVMDHRELWIFGERTTEIFYNSGAADFPFERLPGGFVEKGIDAALSIAKGDNTLFWLADDKTVRRAEGYNPVVVSTRRLERLFESYSKTSDAIGFCYSQAGHAFYVLTFPTAKKTWAYDAATQLWHQRYSFPQYDRHRANCYACWMGRHFVGDYEDGIIWELDLDTYKDGTEQLKRQRTAPPIHSDRKTIFFNSLEIEFKAGVGLNADDADIGSGQDPQAMLDWSDDGESSWSNEHWADIGKIGEYGTRAIWRRLGRSRNRTFRLTITDPVETVIKGASLEATVGAN